VLSMRLKRIQLEIFDDVAFDMDICQDQHLLNLGGYTAWDGAGHLWGH